MSCGSSSFSTANGWVEKIKIIVPRGNASASSNVDGTVTGKSIIYTFTSSTSSSSERTTGSFGAIGDHLNLTGSADSSRTMVAAGDRNSSTKVERGVMSADSRTRSPLADLVISSTPDEEPFQLLALGQIGPWKEPFRPQFVKSSDFGALTRRHISLSDLKDTPQARQYSVCTKSRAPKSEVPASLKVSEADDIRTGKQDIFVQSDGIRSTEVTIPPVWSRKGLPFDQNRRDLKLDPGTFSLPFGVCHAIPRVWIFVS